MKKIVLLPLFVLFALLSNAQLTKTIDCTPGNLRTLLGEDLFYTSTLTITGTLDSRDFYTMHNFMPKLNTLDISAASIVAYSGNDETTEYSYRDYPANAIPMRAFFYQQSLVSVILPNNLTEIGFSAFQGCDNLNSVKIPNGLQTIREYAFLECFNLDSITIPATVTTIGRMAISLFVGVLTIDEANPAFSCIDNVLYDKNKELLISCPIYKTGIFTIPSTVKYIGEFAFYCCNLLKYIEIPESVVEIRKSAFESCQSLDSVHLKSSVNVLGASVFSDCVGLKSIYVEDTVPIDLSLVDSVFWGVDTMLCTLTVPANTGDAYKVAANWKKFVATIFDLGIRRIQCSAGQLAILLGDERTILEKVKIYGTIDSRDFKTIRDDMPMLQQLDLASVYIAEYSGTEGTIWGSESFYPENSVPIRAFYKNTTLKSIILPKTAIELGISSFESCKITDLIIYEGLTIVGVNAFTNCLSLSSINIPASVYFIGQNCFSNFGGNINVSGQSSYFSSVGGVLLNKAQTIVLICPVSKTGNFTVPPTVKYIINSAFLNCNQLNSVVIPPSVVNIGGYAFMNCTSLQKVEFSSSLASIQVQAFRNCSSLSEMKLPDELTLLSTSVFQDCQSLKKIEIPAKVTEIQSSAFAGCTSVDTLIIPASVTSIAANAFSDCSSINAIYVAHLEPLDLSSTPNIFAAIDKSSCFLFCPLESLDLYMNATVWKEFIHNTGNMNPPSSAKPILYVSDGMLTMNNIPTNTMISIIDIQGKILHSFLSQSATFETTLPTKGIYIVRIGTKSTKIIY